MIHKAATNSQMTLPAGVSSNGSQLKSHDNHSDLAMGFDDEGSEPSGYISDEVREVIVLVNLAGICTVMSILGMSTNCMNIVVFLKQGFQDTITMSLFALAISDLAAMTLLFWQTICINPLFLSHTSSRLIWPEIQNITGHWTFLICLRITGWITSYVTIERCVCVIFPLKVKSIVTRSRSKVIIVAIYVLAIASKAPIFYASRLQWKFDSERNTTVFGLVFTDNWEELQKVSLVISEFTFALGFPFLTAVATAILVVSLNKKSQWREKTAANVELGKQFTNRDRKVVKMVITITTIFLVCLFPPSLLSIPMAVDPELKITGRYRNLLLVIQSCFFITETINSSVNLFIYYKMNSSYKKTFLKIFGLKNL